MPAPGAATGGIPPVVNVAAIRRSFPEQWAEYLKLTFKTAYGVQKAFRGIDGHTARDWIGGKAEPRGSVVFAVVSQDPNAIEILGRQHD